MSRIIDQSYLLDEQYKDAANLDARVRLHLLFSVNKYGWYLWCFDQYALPAQARGLEIGCGPAHLWVANLDRLPPDWHITLSDFSSGMLEEAKHNLTRMLPASTSLRSTQSVNQFSFEIVDVQQIPFEADMFDAVIANHMLQHVPDRARALAEMQRVLKPGGVVYLATNSLSHLHELFELEHRFDPAIDSQWGAHRRQSFSLDEGGTEAQRSFRDMRVVRYEDALAVTQAKPLVDYNLSTVNASILQLRRAELLSFIEDELSQYGVIHISKESGMFIGVKL